MVEAAENRISSRPAKNERVAFRVNPEIIQAIEAREEGTEFFYDESRRPEDFTYEWKRLTYAGMEDAQYQAKLKRTGWVPVPASRHPEVGSESGHEVYRGRHGDALIVGGQILMERHMEYTRRARQIADNINAQQIGSQREKLGESDDAYMPRKVTAFKQTYDSGQDVDA